MIATETKCDVCGKTRGDVNHWWLAFDLASGTWQHGWQQTKKPTITFLPWAENMARLEDVKHLCGQQCAQVLQNQWMDKVVAEATNGN